MDAEGKHILNAMKLLTMIQLILMWASYINININILYGSVSDIYIHMSAIH